MARNEQAAALHRRAGNAGTAIAVDTRSKVVRLKRGKGAYDRNRHKTADRAERRSDPDQAAARRPFLLRVRPFNNARP